MSSHRHASLTANSHWLSLQVSPVLESDYSPRRRRHKRAPRHKCLTRFRAVAPAGSGSRSSRPKRTASSWVCAHRGSGRRYAAGARRCGALQSSPLPGHRSRQPMPRTAGTVVAALPAASAARGALRPRRRRAFVREAVAYCAGWTSGSNV